MTRKLGLLFIVITIVFIFVIPAQAIFCPNCGTQNADNSKFCIQCGTKLPNLGEGSIFDQATELLGQKKYDEAILFLEDRVKSNPNDLKVKICLAKAYLAKCDMLKEKGDKQYKDLVLTPFKIGESIIIFRDKYPQHLQDGLYICAHSFLLTNREARACRYIKKAIRLSPLPPAEYYFVQGDAWKAMAQIETDNDTEIQRSQKAYEKIIKMNVSNDVKGLAYYKLAVMCSEFGRKEKAKKSLESGLELAQSEALIQKIRGMQESMQK